MMHPQPGFVKLLPKLSFDHRRFFPILQMIKLRQREAKEHAHDPQLRLVGARSSDSWGDTWKVSPPGDSQGHLCAALAGGKRSSGQRL